MHNTYRLNASELNDDFLQGLKATFRGREIEIIVYEVDETNYLLKSEVNRERLIAAKANIENGTNLIEVSLESLE
jgi:antitoxin YefM